MKTKLISMAAVAFVAAMVGILWATQSSADRPSQADLERLVGETMGRFPGYALTSARFTEREAFEWFGQTAYAMSFEATITSVEPMYDRVNSEEGFIFVEQVAGPGQQATLLGVVNTVLHEGEWTGEAVVEERVGSFTGQTAEQIRQAAVFGGTVVVIGTPDEEEARRTIAQRQDDGAQQVLGEWVGMTACDNPAHNYVYRVNFELGDGPKHFMGVMAFEPVSPNERRQPGSFKARAQINEGIARTNGDVSIHHVEWIERPGRRSEASMGLRFDEANLAGWISLRSGGSCEITLSRP